MSSNLYKRIFLGSLYTFLSQYGHGHDLDEWIDRMISDSGNDSTFSPIQQKGYSINLERVGENPAIVIRAYICSISMDETERYLLRAAIEFWNDQSGKYAYQIKSDDDTTRLPVYFRLMEAPGIYSKSGMFIPSGNISHQLITYLQVVPDEKMQMLDHPESHGHTVGYTTTHHIYISDKYVDKPIISIHEVGHKIGATHTSQSIMARDVQSLKKKVKKKTIRDILRYGGLPVKGKKVENHEFISQISTDVFNSMNLEDIRTKVVKYKKSTPPITPTYYVWDG